MENAREIRARAHVARKRYMRQGVKQEGEKKGGVTTTDNPGASRVIA